MVYDVEETIIFAYNYSKPMDLQTYLTKNYIDVNKAARLLNCHPFTITLNIRRGRLKAYKFNGRYIIEKSELNRFRKVYPTRPGRPKVKKRIQ